MTLDVPSTTLDTRVLAELSRTTLTGMEKSLPQRATGHEVGAFLASSPRLSEFSTPLLVLTETDLEHNLTLMSRWCAARGVGLAPHGKTTMAPALWVRQLAAGAWGISLATPGQVRVAVEFGLRRVLLANALVDPSSLSWMSSRLDEDPGLQVISWVDSSETVAAMEGVLAELAPQRPLSVLVELGAPGGRTGARTVEEAENVAREVASSRWLRLAGVCGYEGALAHDTSETGLSTVRSYLMQLAALHRSLLTSGGYGDAGDVIVTAGGSAYFDEVVDVLGPLADPVGASGPRCSLLLRSGAYLVHDDGFYRTISPLGRIPGQTPFRSAMHAWARVVSRPQAGLALLDAGKRDVPFDEGLPEAQLYADQLGAPASPLTGARVTAVNDQHAFLELDPDGTGADLRVGQVVRLGLSHPCTAFDKWRMIPVLADGDRDDPVVVDLIQTFF